METNSWNAVDDSEAALKMSCYWEIMEVNLCKLVVGEKIQD